MHEPYFRGKKSNWLEGGRAGTQGLAAGTPWRERWRASRAAASVLRASRLGSRSPWPGSRTCARPSMLCVPGAMAGACGGGGGGGGGGARCTRASGTPLPSPAHGPARLRARLLPCAAPTRAPSARSAVSFYCELRAWSVFLSADVCARQRRASRAAAWVGPDPRGAIGIG
jgi:hypothetical protein